MILQKDNHFLLSSKDTSLLIHVNEVKKVSLEYLGKRIDSLDYIDGVIRSYPYLQGSEILYDKEKTGYSLNQAKLLFSTLGKGDFFSPSCFLKSDSLSVFDFCFDHAEIKTPETLASLPCPDGGEEELIITLKEKEKNIFVDLCFTTYQDENVISCFQRVRNEEKEALIVNKLASLQIPLINEGYELYSTYGCWSGELSVQHEKVTRGKKVMESLCGWSSSRHNPFFFLKSENATFDEGHVIGFNLMYSGNFENSVEMDAFENIRVQVSLSPFSFEKRLEEHECFITPVALFSNSQKGVNKMSQDFHSFINRHIIPKEFRGKDRPIAYNNWEATNFDFNQGKINSLIKKASELGIELFVLDDGWFGERNDDTKGLGDWNVNEKKLPKGLKGLAESAKKHGMQFGIWMEPEMVNPNSNLYQNHPDWVIQDSVHTLSEGRNQLVLNLAKKEVQDFVVESVCSVLESADISYLKWDCNRAISDFKNEDGTFFFSYIEGLYSALRRIRERHPNVLMENCASGGNRFDLGMLSFFPQSWQSDDTDSYQRTMIQEGGSLGYPLSTLSNHVACKVSKTRLRNTSLDTKFDVACFGVLGYELDLDDLSKLEMKIIKSQIEFYKKYRSVFQWGTFSQSNLLENKEKQVQVEKDGVFLIGKYQTLQSASPKEKHLTVRGVEDTKLYQYTTRQHSIPLQSFGSLVNYVTPVHINPDGTLLNIISHHMDMKSEIDTGILPGAILSSQGACLSQEWSGVGYDDRVMKLGDFGTRLYLVQIYDPSISQ